MPVALKNEIIDALCDNSKLFGDIYYQTEDMDDAEKKYFYYLKIVGDDEKRMRDINATLQRLAKIHFCIDDFKKAEEYFSK